MNSLPQDTGNLVAIPHQVQGVSRLHAHFRLDFCRLSPRIILTDAPRAVSRLKGLKVAKV